MSRIRLQLMWLLVAALAYGYPSAASAQEPGRMLEGAIPQFLAFRARVGEHLKLSDEQKRKLEARLKSAIEEFLEFAESNRQDRAGADGVRRFEPFLKKTRENLTAFLKETLNNDQLKRYRQILRQREGLLNALSQPEVALELKITDSQRQQIASVLEEMQMKINPLTRQAESVIHPEEIDAAIAKIRREYQSRVSAILSDAQQRQWQEMLGEPFNLDE
ncbi:MAG: hypothetical protein ACT4QC_13135 [Planctomycetaceae bacterium]